ncbi:MAG: hypothetical protein CVT88_03650 [Candidatus Altiarchaeales archaeon HGW-Altiarchaeales-1]|nr:MAG: hypothetical protein CVT88_03650 [Candidatus Altiarchaeales archaeon HGW-Altiarchaeales-1]
MYKKNAHTKSQSHRVYFSFVSRCLRVRIIKRTFLYDKKISEIPEKPDIVVTVVPPKVTENIVDECKTLGINEIWMQPGSESEEAIKKAENFGIKVTYNACIMLETEKS